MSNLDNRIANADQLLTQDVEKLSNSVAELYSNLSKVWASVSPSLFSKQFEMKCIAAKFVSQLCT